MARSAKVAVKAKAKATTKKVKPTAKTLAKKAAPSKPRKRTRRVNSTPVTGPVYHPGPLILDDAVLAHGVSELRKLDPVAVEHILERAGPPPLRQGRRGFDGLVSIVVSQQVSVASAAAIFGRMKDAFRDLEPQAILAAGDEALKACGLSRPKMRTINALAEAVRSGALELDGLGTMSPEEAHATLVAVHGIGPWTADIYLLLCLGHPDAWPVGDIALQEAAKLALNLKTRPDAKGLLKIGERWRPWRGVAARMLWTYYRAVKMREGVRVDA